MLIRRLTEEPMQPPTHGARVCLCACPYAYPCDPVPLCPCAPVRVRVRVCCRRVPPNMLLDGHREIVEVVLPSLGSPLPTLGPPHRRLLTRPFHVCNITRIHAKRVPKSRNVYHALPVRETSLSSKSPLRPNPPNFSFFMTDCTAPGQVVVPAANPQTKNVNLDLGIPPLELSLLEPRTWNSRFLVCG